MTVVVWNDREVLDIKPGYVEGIYGIAVDVGSTTVAAYLCDLRTGVVLATESTMNPQISFGEDLMSRVSYAMMNEDGTEKMHDAIIKALNKLVAQAAYSVGLRARDIYEMVAVGNTTMVHLLLGIDPRELGGAPFALANRDAMDVKARDLGLKLHPAAYLHVLPSEAGHVGADNVGVLIAEEPHRQHEIELIVDVGTNAEIVLGNDQWLLSASSPTGPAFEGAQISAGMRAAPGAIERVRIDRTTGSANFRVIGEARWSDEWDFSENTVAYEQPQHLASGICGSGIIEAIAELYLAGILLPGWALQPRPHDRAAQLGRPAGILPAGTAGADGERAADLYYAGRRAQYPAGQGGAVRRGQAADEACRRRTRRTYRAGGRLWELHRSFVCARAGPDPRLRPAEGGSGRQCSRRWGTHRAAQPPEAPRGAGAGRAGTLYRNGCGGRFPRRVRRCHPYSARHRSVSTPGRHSTCTDHAGADRIGTHAAQNTTK